MRKLMPLLFGATLLLGVSSSPGQEKKEPPTTLEKDWKTLCRFQWVNSDPKEAWALVPKRSKDFHARALGNMGWSRIALSFYERGAAVKGDPKKEDTPRPSPPPAAAAGSAEQAAGLEFSAILGLPGAVKLGEAGDLGR